jgi:hypothetical protein
MRGVDDLGCSEEIYGGIGRDLNDVRPEHRRRGEAAPVDVDGAGDDVEGRRNVTRQ